MRFALAPLFLCSLAPLAAQATLADLQSTFRAEAQRQAASSATPAQRTELLNQQIAQLQKFLAEAKGDDRWNGRLMLAEMQLVGGSRKTAAETLKTIDSKEAGALLLTSAAAMAQHLNLRDVREAWLTAAVAKDAPVADRLAMARLLMTVLHEVERSETIFKDLLAKAPDDEQKAHVLWHRADAMRDREDLPDNAGFDELEKVAKELPATYWGSVAKDRLRATRLQRGEPAIEFRARTRKGEDWALADQRGKVVVLVFWSAADRDLPTLLALLADLEKQGKGPLAIVGINLDRDDAAIAAAVKLHKIDFPVVGEGKGIQTDAALRWMVEGPLVHVIDTAGNVEALGVHAGTADARAELMDAVARARK